MLSTLIEKLRAGCKASNHEIWLAITDQEWQEYESKIYQEKPPKIRRRAPAYFGAYVTCIQRADRIYALAERSRLPMRPKLYALGMTGKNLLYLKAEKEYEHALEVLEELLDTNPEMMGWLDRPLRFDNANAPTPDPESVPRLKTSRSQYANPFNPPRISKRMLKILTLQDSLTNLSERIWMKSDIQSQVVLDGLKSNDKSPSLCFQK